MHAVKKKEKYLQIIYNHLTDDMFSKEKADNNTIYVLTLNKENMTNDNISIIDIVETEENNTLTRTGENTYTAVIPLQKIKNGVTNNIKVSIQWADSEEATQDIAIGATSNPKLRIPMTVHVSQYLGDTITEYVETP